MKIHAVMLFVIVSHKLNLNMLFNMLINVSISKRVFLKRYVYEVKKTRKTLIFFVL